MIKLGELLKNRRKEKGLQIKQVSESTKIPQKLLRALEAGRYETFASEVYLKGLLRNYSKFLGLDFEKVFAIFRRERRALETNGLSDSHKPIESPKALITPARLVFLITAVIVVFVVVFIGIQVNKIIQPPNLELTEPIDIASPAEEFVEVDGDTITIAGTVEVGSKLIINGSEVTTNNLQEFRVDGFKLNPGSNEVYIVAQSYYFSKESQIKLTVLSNQETEDDPEEEGNEDAADFDEGESNDTEGEEDAADEQGAEDAEQERMQIGIIVNPEDAWLVVTVDGTTRIEQVVEAGTSFNFEALEEFTIYSPRPQMVTLTINEEEYTFSSQSASKFRIMNGAILQE